MIIVIIGIILFFILSIWQYQIRYRNYEFDRRLVLTYHYLQSEECQTIGVYTKRMIELKFDLWLLKVIDTPEHIENYNSYSKHEKSFSNCRWCFHEWYKVLMETRILKDIPVTLYMATGFCGEQAGKWLTVKQIIELSERFKDQVRFGSHSHSHCDYRRQDKEDLKKYEQRIEDDLQKSITLLTSYGLKISDFALPFGIVNSFSDASVIHATASKLGLKTNR